MKSPVNGIGYFLLVAGVVLVIGAAVAALLARRISAPLEEAVNTTGKIAGGDLSARVPTNPHDYPEFKELADSINTMGESLAAFGRARTPVPSFRVARTANPAHLHQRLRRRPRATAPQTMWREL